MHLYIPYVYFLYILNAFNKLFRIKLVCINKNIYDNYNSKILKYSLYFTARQPCSVRTISATNGTGSGGMGESEVVTNSTLCRAQYHSYMVYVCVCVNRACPSWLTGSQSVPLHDVPHSFVLFVVQLY